MILYNIRHEEDAREKMNELSYGGGDKTQGWGGMGVQKCEDTIASVYFLGFLSGLEQKFTIILKRVKRF